MNGRCGQASARSQVGSRAGFRSVQQIPARGFAAVAVQQVEAGHAPDIGGNAAKSLRSRSAAASTRRRMVPGAHQLHLHLGVAAVLAAGRAPQDAVFARRGSAGC